MIADDTDILMLLLYHATDDIEITMKSKGARINVNSLRKVIGTEVLEVLLFAHAVSGCDTTSIFIWPRENKSIEIARKVRRPSKKGSNVWEI